MPLKPEFAPGVPAPASGRYELLNVMGSPTATRIVLRAGEPVPPAPQGWTWRLADDQPGA